MSKVKFLRLLLYSCVDLFKLEINGQVFTKRKYPDKLKWGKHRFREMPLLT